MPFTPEQFLAVFVKYNTAIWPLHIVAYILGSAAVALAVWPRRHSDRIIAAILAFVWLWMGGVYHLMFFREINAAATAFGALFLVQGLIWLWAGMVRHNIAFRVRGDAPSAIGGLLIAYAMVVYPIIGTMLGHGYPQSPSFGVAPCPTTIFTCGLLLCTRPPVPKYVLAVPLIWAVIGFGAAVSLGISEDIGLLIAALVGTALLAWRDGRASRSGGLRHRFA